VCLCESVRERVCAQSVRESVCVHVSERMMKGCMIGYLR